MRNLVATKAKANSRYTCRECGSTELVQAHHEIPGDDNSLIILCAECHSKRHPDLPKALFFNQGVQPYWHNKSASSLAKELRVHPRTIIRAAKNLDILPGELSDLDDWRLRVKVARAKKRETAKAPVIRTCPRCGFEWQGKKRNARQTTCPRCGQWIALKRPKVAGIKKERPVGLLRLMTIPFLEVERLKKERTKSRSKEVVSEVKGASSA